MRESAQKPFKSIASHLLEHREVAEYEILIEVFVRFWYILKRENGKRRKSGYRLVFLSRSLYDLWAHI